MTQWAKELSKEYGVTLQEAETVILAMRQDEAKIRRFLDEMIFIRQFERMEAER